MKHIVFLLAILSVILFTAGCTSDKTSSFAVAENHYQQVDAEQAKAMMDSETGYVILDVRTEEEYKQKHIPGAILIPVDEIAERAEKELPDKDQLILVYCRSGNRSKTGSQKLADLGYTRIVEFGGINSWPYETE